MSNAAMPDIVKIGFSTKDPILRAKELEGTGLPHPFVVEYSTLVDDPYKVEQYIHNHLNGNHENKEFFRISVFDVIPIIKSCISNLGQTIHFEEISQSGLHNYESPESSLNELDKILLGIKNQDQDALTRLIEKVMVYEDENDYETIQQIINCLEDLNLADNIEAKFILGSIYNNEDSSHYDPEKAFNIIKESAGKNYSEAQFSLGETYRWGNTCVKRDFDQALYWFNLAAQQNNPNAALSLADFYNSRFTGAREIEKAIFWYKKALELSPNNTYDVLSNLSNIYYSSAEHSKVIEDWYFDLISQGKGLGVRFFDENKKLASSSNYIKALKDSAADKRSEAMKALRDIYRYGLYGVEKNAHEANEWDSLFRLCV